MAASNALPSAARRPLRLLALFLIGAGLVILGVVAGLVLWNPDPARVSDQNGGAVPAKTGFPAPELALQDLAGQDSSLKQYLGGYILVNNWAT